MGTSTTEVQRELASTRDDLDRKLDILEDRARSQVRRLVPIAVAAGGIATAVVVGAVVIIRRRRRPSPAQRVVALMPAPAKRLLDRVELALRRGVPPTRLYIGDRPVGDEPPSSTWQKIGIRLAQAMGTAAGSALIAYGLRRVTTSGRST